MSTKPVPLDGVSAAVSAVVRAEHAERRLEVAQRLADALEHAQEGLLWYQDRYPGTKDGSDDEANALIEAALAEWEATKP